MTNLLVFLWPYPVIFLSYISLRVLLPKDQCILNLERAFNIEAFVNATGCSVLSFVLMDQSVFHFLLAHFICDIFYFVLFRPKDYFMMLHHVISSSLLIIINNNYVSNISIFATGLAEITNILFNTKLFLKSFNKSYLILDKAFVYVFTFIRYFLALPLTILEIYYVQKNSLNLLDVIYIFLTILINTVGIIFSSQMIRTLKRKQRIEL